MNIMDFQESLLELQKNLYTYNKSEIKTKLIYLYQMLNCTDSSKLKKQIDVAVNYFKNGNKTKLNQKLSDIFKTVEAINILWFISEFQGIKESDQTHYEYALNNIKDFTDIYTITRDFDFSQSIHYDLFLAIMQEIIDIKKNGGDVENLFYGRKYNTVNLKPSILDFKNHCSVPNLAWISRIENRIAINYGQVKNLKKIRKLENLLYDIKSVVFQYRNFEDFVEVNNFIFHIVERLLTKKEDIEIGEGMFNGFIENNLQVQNIELRAIDQPRNKKVFDFFREIIFCDPDNFFYIVDTISNNIVKWYYSETLNQNVNLLTTVSFDNCTLDLLLEIDKSNNTIEYIACKTYLPEEKTTRLNLQNFTSTNLF